tara:strand:+ start:316 stop:462 length:147 start_codon:yes stop_codon:yes gene_type:complete
MNKTERFKIQTPIGSVESDSGNHVIDVISVVGIIILVLIGKKLLSKWG